MVNKRQLLIFISILISLFVIGYLFQRISYSRSEVTCAAFTDEWKLRGAKYVNYVFKVKDVDYNGYCAQYDLFIKDIDSLKKINCIQVEYSVWFPSTFNRVIDKRVLK